jgi:hypothetical protein
MSPDWRDKTREYVSPYFFEDNEERSAPRDASRVRITSLALALGDKFDYLFDYGDGWKHGVEVVGISDKQPTGRYPVVVNKHGPSPEQYAPYDESESEDDDILTPGPGSVLPFRRKR